MVRISGWPADVMAAVAGAASVLAFAPFDVWPLAMLCPALLIALWSGASPRRAFLRGLLYGLAEFLAGTYWIYISVSVVGGAPVWLGAVLYLALAAACAVFPGIVGYIACRLAATPGRLWLLSVPPAWVLLEWVRSFLLTGFPWLALGFSQPGTVLGAYAPLAGVYGVSFVCMVIATLLVIALAPAPRLSGRLGALAGIALAFAAGIGLGAIAWTRPSGPPFRISLVQGNIPQRLKWEPQMLDPTLARYSRLTLAHLSSRVIVWPEGSVPVWYGQAAPRIRPLVAAARRHGAVLVLGAPVYDSAAQAAYNAVVVPGTVQPPYFKRHLVPFGEYFPVPEWVKRWLSAHALPYSSYAPGPSAQPPLAVGSWHAAVALCYEIAFGRLLVRQLPAAEFILNLSDDGWFGHSIALPQQFQMARLAARATGRYVTTAADDGITGIIDARGAVLATLPPYRTGVLSGDVVPLTGTTPFVRWGNRTVVVLCGLLLLLAAGLRLRRG